MHLVPDLASPSVQISIPTEMLSTDLKVVADVPAAATQQTPATEVPSVPPLTETPIADATISEALGSSVIEFNIPAGATAVNIQGANVLYAPVTGGIAQQAIPGAIPGDVLDFGKPAAIPGMIGLSEAGVKTFRVTLILGSVGEAPTTMKPTVPGKIILPEAGSKVFQITLGYIPAQPFPFAILAIAVAIGVGLFFGIWALLRKEEIKIGQ